jgi:hypothetical protein
VISETLAKEIIFIETIFRTITKIDVNKGNSTISLLLLHNSAGPTHGMAVSTHCLYLSLSPTHVTGQRIFISRDLASRLEAQVGLCIMLQLTLLWAGSSSG